jgi:colanic acid/amylovoran biosynthesis glycosyltransferase
MKVAFFVWSFPAASETFILNSARAVIESGADLHIYSLQRTEPSSAFNHSVLKRFNLMSRHRGAAAPLGLAARIIGAPRAFLKAVRNHGLWSVLRILPPVSLHRNAIGLRALYAAAALEESSYDIIHCQFASVAPDVLFLIRSGLLQGRLIVHVRGADVSRRSETARLPQYRSAFATADAVIANSRHFCGLAIAAGCAQDKITVIPSATDMAAFPYRPPAPLAGRRTQLVSVSRLVEKKGVRYALDALAMLLADGRDVQMDIIGDGPLRGELEAQAQALEIAGRVTFRGALPSGGVQNAVAAADIFIASSVTAADGDQDAATNTVKEAMATGVPVVASDHGGMPEMIIDGVTGLLVPERDPRAIAGAVKRLIDAPDLPRRLAEAALAKVTTEASREAVDRRLIALYDQVAIRGASKAARPVPAAPALQSS